MMNVIVTRVANVYGQVVFFVKYTDEPRTGLLGVRQKGDLLGPPPVVTTCRSGLAVCTGLASFLVKHHGRCRTMFNDECDRD